MCSEGHPHSGEIAGGDEEEEKEWRLVTQMRAAVELRDPAAKGMDDPMLRRFLRARNLNVEKATCFLLKHLKWRRGAVPNGFISEYSIQNELGQRKSFCQGYDKKGRPIGVILVGKHDAYNRVMEEFKRYCIYLIERICARTTAGQEKFIVIADLKGWGYSNCDIRGYLASLEILQNNYPERLGKVFMLHEPFMFMKAWKIIYHFIDDRSKKKFVFVEDKRLKETLRQAKDGPGRRGLIFALVIRSSSSCRRSRRRRR